MKFIDQIKAKAGMSGKPDDTVFLAGLGFAGPSALIRGLGDIPDYQVVGVKPGGARTSLYEGNDKGVADTLYDSSPDGFIALWYFDHGKRTKTRDISISTATTTKYQVITRTPAGQSTTQYEGTDKQKAQDTYLAMSKMPIYKSIVMYRGRELYMQDTITATYNKLPDGTLISIGASIYLLEGGKKRPIPSMDVFNYFKYDTSKVVKVGADEGNTYPTGEPLAIPAQQITADQKVDTKTDLNAGLDIGTGKQNILDQLKNSIQGGVDTVKSTPTPHKVVAVVGLAGAIGGFAFLILRKKK